MNVEEFRDYCLSKPGVTESFPFDEKVLVFKVMGKIFALADIDDFQSINLKCNPELAVTLREEYPEVLPGYHMNKKHWNTIGTLGTIRASQFREWIDHSYDLIVRSLPKTKQESLKEMR